VDCSIFLFEVTMYFFLLVSVLSVIVSELTAISVKIFSLKNTGLNILRELTERPTPNPTKELHDMHVIMAAYVRV
jgi:hypothetical protein